MDKFKKGRKIVQENCCISSVSGQKLSSPTAKRTRAIKPWVGPTLTDPKNGLFGLFGPFDAKPSKKTDADEIPKRFSVPIRFGAYLFHCICHFWDAFAFALVFVVSYGAL